MIDNCFDAFPLRVEIKYEELMIKRYKNRIVDFRKKVKNTTDYPYSAIGPIVTKQQNGKYYLGTGTLIADQYVITAAHNLYEDGYGSTEFFFSPGMNGNHTDLGFSRGTEFFIFDSYTDNEADIAVVKLEKALGEICGNMDLKLYDNNFNTVLNFFGYPGDMYKRNNYSYGMYGHQIVVDKFEGGNILFQCDSYSGMSGSPIYDYNQENKKASMYGVLWAHDYRSDYYKMGYATVFTEDIIKEIYRYIKEIT